MELLAPAGSWECLSAAVNAGADAVYLGGDKFSARAYADNFNQQKLKEALDFTHLHKKKLYLAVNTLLKKDELEKELYNYIDPLYQNGLDGVIVQDMGVFSVLKRHFKDLPLHMSTQASITDRHGAKMMEDLGASRVVLARELSLDEIRFIHEYTDVEIECFVHGALCYSVSGQCLFSSLLGARSGNRGRCAQTCRLPFAVKSEGQYISDKRNPYVLSLKDLNALELLPQLKSAGVTSLKIEGRMKQPQYTAGVVAIYRKYINILETFGKKSYQVALEDHDMLLDLFNRGGFCRGYYKPGSTSSMITLEKPNHTGLCVGVIEKMTGIQKNKKGNAFLYKICIRAEKALYEHDLLQLPFYIIGHDGARKNLIYTCEHSVEKGELLSLKANGEPDQRHNKVYRVKNPSLYDAIEKSFMKNESKEKINGKLILYEQKHAILSLKCGDIEVNVRGEMPQRAKSKPLDKEQTAAQICKTGNTPFEFASLEIIMEDNLFMPLKALNQLRRDGLDRLQEEMLSPFLRQPIKTQYSTVSYADKEQTEDDKVINKKPGLHILVTTPEQYQQVLLASEVCTLYFEYNYFAHPSCRQSAGEIMSKLKSKNIEAILALPHLWRKQMEKYYLEEGNALLCSGWDGFLIRNPGQFHFLKACGIQGKYYSDYNIYTFQEESSRLWQSSGITMDTVPLELNAPEIKRRGARNSQIIIYGYIPVMLSVQCLDKNCGKCVRNNKSLYLQDRYKKEFRVDKHCSFCYNVIYNCEPLNLLDRMERIQSFSPAAVRINFTSESAKQVSVVMSMLCKNKGAEMGSMALRSYTRGHFNRGVE